MPPPSVSEALASLLYDEAGAAQWDLPPHAFRAALDRSVTHAVGTDAATAADVERHARSLHLMDLALAAACREGHAGAWDHFVREVRPALYRAADAIDRSGAARELADELYGDLFGTETREGERQSLLRYFHGRSSLATWLRAVLAQRVVDQARARHRLEPMADEPDVPTEKTASPDGESQRLRDALSVALAAAVAALAPRDRLRLACYHARGLTLAAVGRALGEHEATVSRQLARTRRALRQDIERRLAADHGLDAAAIREAWGAVIDDAGTLDVSTLIGPADLRKKAHGDRSKDSESDENIRKERE